MTQSDYPNLCQNHRAQILSRMKWIDVFIDRIDHIIEKCVCNGCDLFELRFIVYVLEIAIAFEQPLDWKLNLNNRQNLW